MLTTKGGAKATRIKNVETKFDVATKEHLKLI